MPMLTSMPTKIDGSTARKTKRRKMFQREEPIERATSLGLVSDFAAADALRVAWTIADLNGRERPTRGDCAAALGLRMGEMR